MVRIFRHYVSPVKLTMVLVDMALLLLAVFIAEWARHTTVGSEPVVTFAALMPKVILPFVAGAVLLGVGCYESEALRDLRIFVLRLSIGLIGTSIVMSAFLFLFPTLPLWRSILVMAVCGGGVLIYISHLLFLSLTSTSFLGHKVIVLGAGQAALELLQMSGRAAAAGLNIVQVVSLSNEKEVCVDTAVPYEDIDNLEAFCIEKSVELIIIAGSDVGDLPIEDLIVCKLAGIDIQDRLAFFEQVRGYVDLESVRAEWIVFSDGFKGGSSLERLWKRLSDVAVSLLAVIVFSPIMVLAALVVSVTSKGPVFYKQERVGLNGKPFGLLKFRSMKVDAEKEGSPEWAQENDPRVTLVGGFLRRTRIDELPQVINVLLGDMSFVGPRPERPFFVQQLQEDIPFYKERHCLKPGITGWAQIQYPYGASMEDSRRKLEYDLYYIKNYSIFLDFLIILQTLRVILFPVGVR